MNKQELIRKLSSRKFWTAIAAWLTSLLTAFNVADATKQQVGLVVTGIGALAVYMLAEGIADKGRSGAASTETTLPTIPVATDTVVTDTVVTDVTNEVQA